MVRVRNFKNYSAHSKLYQKNHHLAETTVMELIVNLVFEVDTFVELERDVVDVEVRIHVEAFVIACVVACVVAFGVAFEARIHVAASVAGVVAFEVAFGVRIHLAVLVVEEQCVQMSIDYYYYLDFVASFLLNLVVLFHRMHNHLVALVSKRVGRRSECHVVAVGNACRVDW